MHLEGLSPVSKRCRDVDYVATMILHTEMMGDSKSMQWLYNQISFTVQRQQLKSHLEMRRHSCNLLSLLSSFGDQSELQRVSFISRYLWITQWCSCRYSIIIISVLWGNKLLAYSSLNWNWEILCHINRKGTVPGTTSQKPPCRCWMYP